MSIILFLLKISSPVLNKRLLEQSNAIKSIFFNKTIVQSISPTATILKVIFLQKKSILETEISSSNLSIRSLIADLIINQLTKFVLFKLYIFYINLSVRRKSAKTRQKTA